MRGHGVQLARAHPYDPKQTSDHFVPLKNTAPGPMAAWDENTVILVAGDALVYVDMVSRRWSRWDRRLSTSRGDPANVVGLGRAGAALAVVLAEGDVLVFGPAPPEETW